MKNLLFIIAALLIALNTIIGLIVTDYAVLNFMLANLSIVLSAAIIYFVTCSKVADGFKIGLTGFFFFTGIIRYLCVAFAPKTLADNTLFIVAISILFFEIVCLGANIMISKKQEEAN